MWEGQIVGFTEVNRANELRVVLTNNNNGE